jgi:hypothetical protein
MTRLSSSALKFLCLNHPFTGKKQSEQQFWAEVPLGQISSGSNQRRDRPNLLTVTSPPGPWQVRKFDEAALTGRRPVGECPERDHLPAIDLSKLREPCSMGCALEPQEVNHGLDIRVHSRTLRRCSLFFDSPRQPLQRMFGPDVVKLCTNRPSAGCWCILESQSPLFHPGRDKGTNCVHAWSLPMLSIP